MYFLQSNFTINQKSYKFILDSILFNTLLITPQPTRNFVYQASILWNRIRPTLAIRDFSSKLCPIKTKIKEILLKAQKLGDEIEWSQENVFS